MPVRERTRHEFPRKAPKADSMFAKSDSGAKPHQSTLAYALKIGSQVKPKRGTTKTLSR